MGAPTWQSQIGGSAIAAFGAYMVARSQAKTAREDREMRRRMALANAQQENSSQMGSILNRMGQNYQLLIPGSRRA